MCNWIESCDCMDGVCVRKSPWWFLGERSRYTTGNSIDIDIPEINCNKSGVWTKSHNEA